MKSTKGKGTKLLLLLLLQAGPIKTGKCRRRRRRFVYIRILSHPTATYRVALLHRFVHIWQNQRVCFANLSPPPHCFLNQNVARKKLPCLHHTYTQILFPSLGGYLPFLFLLSLSGEGKLGLSVCSVRGASDVRQIISTGFPK